MSLKEKTFKGVIWSAIERFSTQGIQFAFGIILARLLTPADYGMIAMLTIFLAISQTFIDSGFGNALIRKIDRTEKDKATVFFFNIFMSFACYGIIFATAPSIAKFYSIPELTLVLRILAINLIIQSFTTIQRINLTIDLNFKKQAKISLTGVIISGCVGLWFAYNGYGVWSLVIQQTSNTFTQLAMFWVMVRWRPTCFFDKASFKNMFGFGSKLLASGLLDTIYRNMYDLIIGKVFTSSTLGVYTRASHFAQFPSTNITGIFQRVTYPVLSKLQGDKDKLRDSYLKFLNISTLVIFPLMVGLAALAKPLVLLLLTDKWFDVILLLQIICISKMWYPVHAINLNILQVIGRSDLFLKIEIIKKIAGIIILCATVPLGIVAMCFGQWVSCAISLIINTYYSGKLLDAGLSKQLKFYVPTLINSLIMGLLSILATRTVPENHYALQILVGTIAGGFYYILTTWIFNKEIFTELLGLIYKKRTL